MCFDALAFLLYSTICRNFGNGDWVGYSIRTSVRGHCNHDMWFEIYIFFIQLLRFVWNTFSCFSLRRVQAGRRRVSFYAIYVNLSIFNLIYCVFIESPSSFRVLIPCTNFKCEQKRWRRRRTSQRNARTHTHTGAHRGRQIMCRRIEKYNRIVARGPDTGTHTHTQNGIPAKCDLIQNVDGAQNSSAHSIVDLSFPSLWI